MYDNIIPLGDHCAPAMILQNLNLRKKAYPFDWCSHVKPDKNSNIEFNINCLLELLNKSNYEEIRNKMLSNKISNTQNYNGDLLFPHENENIELTNEKYLRRIKRLHNDITNLNKNLYIVVTRFSTINEDIFSLLYDKLLEYNKNSYILLISGVNYNFKNE